MISFETWQKGFIITIEGKRTLWHSSLSPSIFVGLASDRGRNSVNGDAAGKKGKNPLAWRPLGGFKVLNEGGESVGLNFEVGLSISFAYARRVFKISPRSINPAIAGLRIVFGADKRERVFGLGPSCQFDLKGKSLSITASMSKTSSYCDPRAPRIPVVFFDSGRWISARHEGGLSFDFEPNSTRVETRGLPKELLLSFPRNPQEGFRLLSDAETLEEKAGLVHEIRLSDAEGLKTEELVNGLLSLSFSGVPAPSAGVDEAQSTGMNAARWSRLGDLRLFSPAGMGGDFLGWLDAHGINPHLTKRDEEIERVIAGYRTAALDASHESGTPALCHPSVFYPNEPLLLEYSTEYMFGRDLLVAPSLDDMKRERLLYLPNDSWVHLWTSRRFGGGKTTVDAPVGRPAVFYREKSEFASLFEAIRQLAVRL